MQLGNHIMDEIHPLFTKQLLSLKRDKTNASSALEDDLLESENLFLRAAEGVYKQALALIKQQLSCYSNANISEEKRWEKTQHLLLRARAQYNIGISLLKLAQCDDLSKDEKIDMLLDAHRTFEDASQSCDKIRHNTILASKEMSTHNKSKTWEELALLQTFQSIELFLRSQNELCICLWELGRFGEANSVMMKVDTSQILELENRTGVDLFGILRLLYNAQLIPVSLLDLSTQSLENTPSTQRKSGEKLLEVSQRAVKSAADVSNTISAFVEKHSLDKGDKYFSIMQHVLTVEQLKDQEGYIANVWQSKSSSFAADDKIGELRHKRNNDINRGELHNDLQRVSFQSVGTRVTISDSHHSHGRRRRRIRENSNVDTRAAAAESFQSAFSDSAGDDPFSSNGEREITRQKYMPWGDEMPGREERSKYPASCPPLPHDMPLEIRRALEARLGDILPSN